MDYNNLIICPIPGLGHCIRERCTFWEAATDECACDCFVTGDPAETGSVRGPDEPCVISYDEDYD